MTEMSKEWWEWEGCCETKSCRSRTIRPTSACNQSSIGGLKRRPMSRCSALSSEWGSWLRRGSPSSAGPGGRSQGLDHFRRSLRLLGLRPEELGLPPSPQHDKHPKPDLRSAKPKVNTRLQRRTVSEDDLRHLLEDPVVDDFKRGLVSKAVYEEWYFKKQEDLKKRKEMEIQQEKVKTWENQHSKREQIIRSKEKYDEWINKKSSKKPNMEKPDKKIGIGRRAMSNPEQAELAFYVWKRNKDKQLREMKMSQKKNETEEEKEKKRLEAEKAFQFWRTKKGDELKKIISIKETIEKKSKEEEERQKQQKERDSEISFKVWKLKKDRELQEKILKAKADEERKKEEIEKKLEERRYEANQAYLGWLDTLNERQEAAKRKAARNAGN